MGRLADRLGAITIVRQSPDQRIVGELKGMRSFDFFFADEDAYYEYSTETAIAHQLRQLVNDLFASRDQERRVAIESTGLSTDNSPHWNAANRRFEVERDKTIAAGVSREEYIEVSALAMRAVELNVSPEALDDLDAAPFLREVRSAIEDLHEDWRERVFTLKKEHLGLRTPPLPESNQRAR